MSSAWWNPNLGIFECHFNPHDKAARFYAYRALFSLWYSVTWNQRFGLYVHPLLGVTSWQFAANPAQFGANPAEFAANPDQFTANPPQFAANPAFELAANPAQFAANPTG